jgi:hypothetical protein
MMGSRRRVHTTGRSSGRVGTIDCSARESFFLTCCPLHLGSYNYPISFAIPASSPPTIHADFGSVTYRLRATVIRAGALTPNYVEDVEVMVIASPNEDDLEETENVIVERQWEDQMR